ncbi:MAG: hypothetical protein J6B85_06585 [Lachnospiraceae bacterium]|nr:hypothetical protein [Lachnospiraceae bacterium]
MNNQEKQTYFSKFNNQLHILGRITLVIATLMMLAAPFVIGILLDSTPSLSGFAKGIIKVGLIYIPVGIVEFLVYAPMLGAGGSYLSFLTGNVTNLKIPCAMNARDIAKTEVGTPENEIISTLSVATSSLVTMLVIFIGVLLLVPLSPILSNPTLTPAFDNVVPALFGALGLKYFLKSPKIAIIPLICMTLLCVLVPAAISQTSLLLIPAGGLALAIGFLLFKKGKL